MVSRLKCQFNKHRSRIDNILKTTARRRLLEPERERPETIHPRTVLKRLGTQPRPGQDRRQ